MYSWRCVGGRVVKVVIVSKNTYLSRQSKLVYRHPLASEVVFCLRDFLSSATNSLVISSKQAIKKRSTYQHERPVSFWAVSESDQSQS